MLFIVSDNDEPVRYEQTQLLVATLKYQGYDESRYKLKVMHGGHCEYIKHPGEFEEMIIEFVKELQQ